jgi:hypothetical protein
LLIALLSLMLLHVLDPLLLLPLLKLVLMYHACAQLHCATACCHTLLHAVISCCMLSSYRTASNIAHPVAPAHSKAQQEQVRNRQKQRDTAHSSNHTCKHVLHAAPAACSTFM